MKSKVPTTPKSGRIGQNARAFSFSVRSATGKNLDTTEPALSTPKRPPQSSRNLSTSCRSRVKLNKSSNNSITFLANHKTITLSGDFSVNTSFVSQPSSTKASDLSKNDKLRKLELWLDSCEISGDVKTLEFDGAVTAYQSYVDYLSRYEKICPSQQVARAVQGLQATLSQLVAAYLSTYERLVQELTISQTIASREKTHEHAGIQTRQKDFEDPDIMSAIEKNFTPQKDFHKVKKKLSKLMSLNYSGCDNRLKQVLRNLNSSATDVPDETDFPDLDHDSDLFGSKLRDQFSNFHTGTKRQIARALIRTKRNWGTQTDAEWVDPETYHKLRMDFRELERDHAVLLDSMKAIEDQMKKQSRDMTDLQAALAEARAQLKSTQDQLRRLEFDCSDLKERVGKLKTLNRSLTIALDNMRGERDDLSATLKADQERHAKLLADANRARDEAQAALEADKRKMEDLKSRMEEQAANLRHLEQEQSRLHEQNQRLQTEKADLAKKHSDSVATIAKQESLLKFSESGSKSTLAGDPNEESRKRASLYDIDDEDGTYSPGTLQRTDTSEIGIQYNYRNPNAEYDSSGNVIRCTARRRAKSRPETAYNPRKLQGDVFFSSGGSAFVAQTWKPDGHSTAFEGLHMDSPNSRHRTVVVEPKAAPVFYGVAPASPRKSVSNVTVPLDMPGHDQTCGPDCEHLRRVYGVRTVTTRKTELPLKKQTILY